MFHVGSLNQWYFLFLGARSGEIPQAGVAVGHGAFEWLDDLSHIYCTNLYKERWVNVKLIAIHEFL